MQAGIYLEKAPTPIFYSNQDCCHPKALPNGFCMYIRKQWFHTTTLLPALLLAAGMLLFSCFCSSRNSPLHHAGLLLQCSDFLYNMGFLSSSFSLNITLLPICDTFHGILPSKFLIELKCTLLNSSSNTTTHIPISPLDPELNSLVIIATETAAPFDPSSSLSENDTSKECCSGGQFHNFMLQECHQQSRICLNCLHNTKLPF